MIKKMILFGHALTLCFKVAHDLMQLMEEMIDKDVLPAKYKLKAVEIVKAANADMTEISATIEELNKKEDV